MENFWVGNKLNQLHTDAPQLTVGINSETPIIS